MSDHNNSPEQKPMEGHAYDGIQELDNPLPRWWLYGFYLTIVFGALYFSYYELGSGVSLNAAYEARVAGIRRQRAAVPGNGFDETAFAALLNDTAAMRNAHEMYEEKCAACHGDKGQGVIGPNLTDKFWIHGGMPGQILKTIRAGVGDKGMPAWSEQLKDDETLRLTAYVVSLQGTNPAGAKEPQGTPIEADPAVK